MPAVHLWHFQRLRGFDLRKQLPRRLPLNFWNRSVFNLRCGDLLGFTGCNGLHLMFCGELLRHRRHCCTSCMLRGDVLVGILHGVLNLCHWDV